MAKPVWQRSQHCGKDHSPQRQFVYDNRSHRKDYDFPSKTQLLVPAGIKGADGGWISRKPSGTDLPGPFETAVTLEQAQANLESIAINLDKLYPVQQRFTGNIEPMLQRTVKDIRQALLVLLGAVDLCC